MSNNTPPAFTALEIHDWRQFEGIEIQFDDRLTVLTGANASGKSTILNVLARHFAWQRLYLSAPRREKDRWLWSVLGRLRAQVPQGTQTQVGSLTYGSGAIASLVVPEGSPNERTQYDIQLNPQQSVTGLYLASHRVVAGNYVPVASIPTAVANPDQMLDLFTNEVRTRWLGSYSQKSPMLVLKESLLSAAVFGQGGEAVERDSEAAEIWTGFQNILQEIFPRSLGYRRLRVRNPDIIVETETDDFVFDEASGGLVALIEVAWQIFLRSRRHEAFTVLLDEPENHLHPSLQR